MRPQEKEKKATSLSGLCEEKEEEEEEEEEEEGGWG